MNLAGKIKQKAIEIGFDMVGITSAEPIDVAQIKVYNNWLKSGYAGQMDYLSRNVEKRFNPSKLLRGAQSVIVVGLNYKTAAQKSQSDGLTGKVVTYAQYEDYHVFIRKKLRGLADFIKSLTVDELAFKVCVDSVPLAERALAVRAGLGFIGKNHMLINPKLGCQVFLGEIVIDLKLDTDSAMNENCGNCNFCIQACPAGALRKDGQFDATKCVNYLTIEYKDEIPQVLACKIGERVFGCEECVLVCPWQKRAPVSLNSDFKCNRQKTFLNLEKILTMNQEDFDVEFVDSPIRRLGLSCLKRNAQICLDNIKK